MLHIKESAREQGYVTTLLGRRRWIPELQRATPTLRGAGERMAINMPIQGTAADIMKIAMIRLSTSDSRRRGSPRADAAAGPRRAAARGAARRRRRRWRRSCARTMESALSPRRAARRRRQGRRRLGVDDAVSPDAESAADARASRGRDDRARAARRLVVGSHASSTSGRLATADPPSRRRGVRVAA